jgi:hypothetical protein
MSTRYEDLINELRDELRIRRIELRIRRIEYKRILRLINRQEYEAIKAIVNDTVINHLIDEIVNELELIGTNVANTFNRLVLLNDLLIIFNEDPQPSLTKARKLFKKKVFINIYDLAAKRYHGRYKTKGLLLSDLQNENTLRFPLRVAKRHPVLKCFLWKIF